MRTIVSSHKRPHTALIYRHARKLAQRSEADSQEQGDITASQQASPACARARSHAHDVHSARMRCGSGDAAAKARAVLAVFRDIWLLGHDAHMH